MGDNDLSQNDIDNLFAGGAEGESATPGTGETPATENTDEKPANEQDPGGDEGTPKGEIEEETQTATAVAEPPDEKPVAQPVEFAQLQKRTAAAAENDIGFLLDVPLNIAVELGRTRMFVKDVLGLGVGSVVELNKLAGEPVDLLINNKLVARGEVVVINENFGVKVIDIISPEQRIKNLS